MPDNDPINEFLRSSVWHGRLEPATQLLAAHPEIATANIHTAAVLGEEATVRRLLANNATLATAKGGPHGWDALTYLCFSKFLRLDRARSEAFVRTATALLDAGADARTGFWDETHQPTPDFESALYAAAGVAHHAGVTRLLLERGADPNEGEVAYHAPETDDNDALSALVSTGKLTADSLATMLLRKADWHDADGSRLLLEHGASPNHITHWGFTALHQAVRRDNAIEHIQLLLDHGANPSIPNPADGKSSWSLAARRGRGDALGRFLERGSSMPLAGLERLAAACALNDAATIQSFTGQQPRAVEELRSEGGALLAAFAGNGNGAGLQHLLDLGVPVDERFKDGDSYYDVASNSTALHVAAWRARPIAVDLLLARGAAVDPVDGKGRTPLQLAVRACVDSFWTERRSPDSVRALLNAGASVRNVKFPSGYREVDELLQARGATG